MATYKAGDGEPVALSKSFRVTNRANQPREFFLRGDWYRWEPAGLEGSSKTLPAAVIESADFARVAKYFSVAEV